MDSKTKQFRVSQWIQIMEAQAQSGLNKEEWCKRQGISRNQFFYWQKVIRRMAHAGELPMEVPPSEHESAFFEIVPESSSEQVCHNDEDVNPRGISSYSCLVPEKIQVSVSCGKFAVNIYDEWIRESTLTTVLRAVAHAD